MIDRISLENVRVFTKAQPFELKNLTIFTGTNSSGKSTVLKVLPLLRQTQGIRETAESDDGRLRLRGGQVDLGRYQSFISDNETERNMHFGMSFSNGIPSGWIRWLKSVKGPKHEEFKWASKSDDKIVPYSVDCSFRFSAGVLPLSDQSPISGTLVEADFKLRFQNEMLLSWKVCRIVQETGLPGKNLYRLVLPKDFWSKSGMSALIQPLARPDEESVEHIVAIKGILPAVILAHRVPARGKNKTKRGAETNAKIGGYDRWPLPPIIDQVLTEFKSALQEVHYVGPLRSPGKRIYVADYDASPGLDPTGDFLPFLLRDKGETKVVNFHPTGNGKTEEPLLNALSYWMEYLRTDKFSFNEANPDINLSTKDGILLELKVQSPHAAGKYTLADSGFGYSQIMPVLTRGLLTKVGGTLVVEQPELHLHPALQVRLATFFLAMAQVGKQVIVETHSEHLVNAIRVAVAESEEAKLASLCKIYFIESSQGAPVIHDLSVREDGMLNEWPASFFGDALHLSGRLLRAQRKFLKGK